MYRDQPRGSPGPRGDPRRRRASPYSRTVAPSIPDAPSEFQEVLRSIQGARVRRDVAVVEAPAPGRIAPYAVAINGELTGHPDLEANGRFVVLYDPAGHDAWEGTLRIVALVKAAVDPEVGSDDLWDQVAWSWIADALEPLPHRALGGTVTKVTDRNFGDQSAEGDAVRVEMRVSWTPLTAQVGPHLEAWAGLVAACAGVPPLPDGVSMLPGANA